MSETGDRSSRGGVDVDDDMSEASVASSSRAAAGATELSATVGGGGGPPRSMADDAILGAGALSSSSLEPARSPVPDDPSSSGGAAPRATRSVADVANLMAPDPPAVEYQPPRETILGTGMKWRNKWRARIHEWAPNYEDECGPKMNFGCCACSTLLLVIVAIFIVVPARSCSCPDGTRNCCNVENFTLAFGILACVALGIMSMCCIFCFAMGYASQKMQQKEQGADEVRNAVREAMV